MRATPLVGITLHSLASLEDQSFVQLDYYIQQHMQPLLTTFSIDCQNQPKSLWACKCTTVIHTRRHASFIMMHYNASHVPMEWILFFGSRVPSYFYVESSYSYINIKYERTSTFLFNFIRSSTVFKHKKLTSCTILVSLSSRFPLINWYNLRSFGMRKNKSQLFSLCSLVTDCFQFVNSSSISFTLFSAIWRSLPHESGGPAKSPSIYWQWPNSLSFM